MSFSCSSESYQFEIIKSGVKEMNALEKLAIKEMKHETVQVLKICMDDDKHKKSQDFNAIMLHISNIHDLMEALAENDK